MTTRASSFIFEETLGKGSTGTVFLAKDKRSGNHVAIKVVPKRGAWRDVSLREISIPKRVKHKNIISVVDAFENDKNVYIVTEYVNNSIPLSKWKPSSLLAMTILFSELVDAMIFMHSKGVVHSDIKPANILVKGELIKTDEGEELLVNVVPVVIDFDSACIPDSIELKCRKLAGTPNYLAPEIWDKTPDPDLYKVDTYALGVTFYAVANQGKVPYPDPTSITDLRNKIAFDDPVPSNSGSSKLDEIIMALLIKDPKQRLDLIGAKVLLDFLIKEL